MKHSRGLIANYFLFPFQSLSLPYFRSYFSSSVCLPVFGKGTRERLESKNNCLNIFFVYMTIHDHNLFEIYRQLYMCVYYIFFFFFLLKNTFDIRDRISNATTSTTRNSRYKLSALSFPYQDLKIRTFSHTGRNGR